MPICAIVDATRALSGFANLTVSQMSSPSSTLTQTYYRSRIPVPSQHTSTVAVPAQSSTLFKAQRPAVVTPVSAPSRTEASIAKHIQRVSIRCWMLCSTARASSCHLLTLIIDSFISSSPGEHQCFLCPQEVRFQALATCPVPCIQRCSCRVCRYVLSSSAHVPFLWRAW